MRERRPALGPRKPRLVGEILVVEDLHQYRHRFRVTGARCQRECGTYAQAAASRAATGPQPRRVSRSATGPRRPLNGCAFRKHCAERRKSDPPRCRPAASRSCRGILDHWARASIAGSSCLRFTILLGSNIRDELAAKYGVFVAPFVATRAERPTPKLKNINNINNLVAT
jgi:hypothetical protein